MFMVESGLPRWCSAKEPSANEEDAIDTGSIPGLGRSPGGRNSKLLEYSCGLVNPMDRGSWWATTEQPSTHTMIESRQCVYGGSLKNSLDFV